MSKEGSTSLQNSQTRSTTTFPQRLPPPHKFGNSLSLIQVDWDVIAQKSGYNNGNTAKTRFNQIKKKYFSPANHGVPGSHSPNAPAKPRAKKENAEKAVGSGTNTGASKVTKARTPKKKSKATKDEENTEPMEDAVADQAEPIIEQDAVKGEALEATEVKDDETVDGN